MPASPPPIPSTLQQRTDDWFRRSSAALLGQVPCRAGCSHCCVGPFPITILDIQSLKQGLGKLPQQTRAHVEQRAAEQISAMEAAYPRLIESPILDEWPDTEIDRLVGQFGTTPCPALADNGLCLVYAHRPLTCRSMGIPIEEGALTQGACQVQTFVPIVRLSAALRAEEQNLAGQEAALLSARQRTADSQGEELLLPYGFHPQLLRTVGRQST